MSVMVTEKLTANDVDLSGMRLQERFRISKSLFSAWEWQFTPVIPALFEADHLRSGVRDQDGQHGGTRSLSKYKN